MRSHLSRVTQLLDKLVPFIQREPLNKFRAFSIAAMDLIDRVSRRQDRFQHGPISEAMYRAFDQMDEILGIRYELDSQMVTELAQPERLYEGAGAGVQTSYSSISLALDRAQIPREARVVDLGSGYGRVGFVLGLLRPDLHFTGIEYVEHRVNDSRAVAERVGLQQTKFQAGDLKTLALPDADVYYMYDPFCRETYELVLNQLVGFGKKSQVLIITKGRANTWAREALEPLGWSIDESCDSGTVHLFRSPL